MGAHIGKSLSHQLIPRIFRRGPLFISYFFLLDRLVAGFCSKFIALSNLLEKSIVCPGRPLLDVISLLLSFITIVGLTTFDSLFFYTLFQKNMMKAANIHKAVLRRGSNFNTRKNTGRDKWLNSKETETIVNGRRITSYRRTDGRMD